MSDEGGYAYAAYWWSKGLHLYDELWFDRPQAIFVIYRIIFATLGSSVVSIRIGIAIVSAFAALMVYLVTKRYFDRQTALLAGVFFAVFSAAPQIEGFTANAESFMICPAIAAVYLFLRGRDTRQGVWFFVAGACASVAAQIKPSELAALLLLTILTRFLLNTARLRSLLLIGSGFCVALLPALIHGYVTGWSRFTFAVVRYRLLRDSLATRSIGWHLQIIYEAAIHIAPALAVLAILTGVTFMYQRRSSERYKLFFPACWILTSLGGVALGGNWYDHYFIQMVAPLSMTAAYGLVTLYRSFEPAQAKRFVAVTVTSLVLTFAFAFKVVLLRDPRQIGFEVYARLDRFIYNADIAEYVKERTNPDDRLYIMYSAPEILYLSERRAAYPFLYNKELDRLDPDGKELVQDLTDPATRPTYIVDLRGYGYHLNHDPLLINLLRKDYTVERTFGVNIVYRLKNSSVAALR
jgi:4-amino-4-deoxy-L-arabinose transferase-like glycosyltransferase